MNVTERPRERLLRLGSRSLSDRELLAIILRNGALGESALDLADELLDRFGGALRGVSGAALSELCAVHGMGEAKATSLVAAFELGRRLQVATPAELPLATSPGEIANYMRNRQQQFDQEEFHVLLLNTRCQIIGEELITLGLLNKSLVHAREVFRTAIRSACYQILVCHNHPAGDPQPSDADIQLTRNLIIAGKIIDIQLLDHIIIGDPATDPEQLGYFSFAEHHLMELPNPS